MTLCSRLSIFSTGKSWKSCVCVHMQSTHCKSSMFGMPRALPSLSKHCSAHVAQPGAGHRGVGALSCRARLLWLRASVPGPDLLPQLSPQVSWGPGPLPCASFLMLGLSVWLKKRPCWGNRCRKALQDQQDWRIFMSLGDDGQSCWETCSPKQHKWQKEAVLIPAFKGCWKVFLNCFFLISELLI